LSGEYLSVTKNTNSGLLITTPDQPTDQKNWYILTFGSTLSINAYNDGGGVSQSAMSFTRSGYTVTGFSLNVNSNAVISANSNRQVTIGAPASGSHTINGNVSFSGIISGNGSGLTSLNADNLASGIIPGARFPSTLPAVSGANLTNLNASSITSGTVAPARLGSGSPSSSAFLRGDGTWTNTLSGDYLILSKNTNSGIFFHTADQAVDQKYWGWITANPELQLRTYSDNWASSQRAMVFLRSGLAVTGWYFYVSDNAVISADSNRQVTIYAPVSGAHSINGKTTYTPSNGPSNVEIGFRTIPRTADTTLNTAKVGQCIATFSSLTIPANVYSAGDIIYIHNNTNGTITLTQGSGLTLYLAGTGETGNRTLSARGIAIVWYNSSTEAIIRGAGLS
jgi:hypothetical protein